MDGIVAQYLAVAFYGNYQLSGRGPIPNMELENSTFRYVSRVGFNFLSGAYADSVGEWLAQVGETGTREILLHVPQIRLDAGLGQATLDRFSFVDNRPGIGLRLDTPEGPRLWGAAWRTKHSDPLTAPPPDPRPWTVHYVESQALSVPIPPAADNARRDLVLAIETALDFARQHGLHPWDLTFAEALAIEAGQPPVGEAYPDLSPTGFLDPDQRGLLSAAMKAYVFGGMGSWNDVSFASDAAEDIYLRVSERLLAAVLQAFIVCVSTSDASR